MSEDLIRIQTIKTQTLARIAEVTAQPKPTYYIDGQSVSWNAYLAELQKTIDWCERKLAAEAPFEIRSEGTT
jgi:hypothetical protein